MDGERKHAKTVYLSEDEYQAIRRQAYAEDVTVNKWIAAQAVAAARARESRGDK